MKIVYDGPSLPMVEMGSQILTVQFLINGRWETVTTPEIYKVLFPGIEETPKPEVHICEQCGREI